jgi:hypothetical protein
MTRRPFGALGEVSALTLGGAGLMGGWGHDPDLDEAVATIRAAVDAGIDHIDVAPGYGDGGAEQAVGSAFGGALPAGVRISTKVPLDRSPPGAAPGLIERVVRVVRPGRAPASHVGAIVPFPVFSPRECSAVKFAHGRQDVRVPFSGIVLVPGDVGDHSAGYELFPDVPPDKGLPRLSREFVRDRDFEGAGRLAIPLAFGSFRSVPKLRPIVDPIRGSGRREDLGRRHDASST